MLDQRLLHQQWSQFKEKLQQHWAELAADDLALFNGTVDELVELIGRRTGEAKESIQIQLKSIADDLASLTQQAAEAFERIAEEAQEEIDDAAAPLLDSLAHACRRARTYVRRHPAEAMGISLAVGVLAGVVLSWSKRRE